MVYNFKWAFGKEVFVLMGQEQSFLSRSWDVKSCHWALWFVKSYLISFANIAVFVLRMFGEELKIQNRYWRTCGSSHYYYYSFKFGDPFNGFVNFPKDSSEDNEILRASEWDEFQEWYEEEGKRMLKKKSLMKLAYNYIFLVINFCSVLVEKGLETKKCNYVEHAT